MYKLIVFETPPRDPAWNMAVDEGLLLAEIPALRFYDWETFSYSIGYFQKINGDLSLDRPFVRRWTGGGIVPHGDDLTFSLVLALESVPFLKNIQESYGWIHGVLKNAFVSLGVSAEVYEGKSQEGNFCFQTPVKGDLVVESRKIAGGAQRRRRGFLLHQGSIHLENGIERNDLIYQIHQAFSKVFDLNFQDSDSMICSLEALPFLHEKYLSPEWNEKF
ncbi:MAG: lipoate--protein ligase family protein [Chlamydiae bacterium]|nr:lipoate--protein ligase family protein [Chlamydiota bacterium]MBI3267020.1 lipoate--protein ligase family protein [Chlamydiota bacterium]